MIPAPPIRFSLRLLVICLTLTCLGLGIWTHRARQQQRLVECIRESGGRVGYRQQLLLADGRIGPFQIAGNVVKLLGNDYFFDIVDAEVLDVRLLAEVARLRSLEVLHINASALTDDDFAPVARLRRLKGVDVYGDRKDPNTRLGSRSIALLATLPDLELINLESCRLKAGDLEPLTRSNSLDKLYVASPDQSFEDYAAEAFQGRLSHLMIRHSTPGAFGKIVQQWQGRVPPAAAGL